VRIPREFFFEITLAKFIFPNFSPNVGSMQNSATQKDYATQNGYMGHVSTLTTRDTTKYAPSPKFRWRIANAPILLKGYALIGDHDVAKRRVRLIRTSVYSATNQSF